MSLFEDWSVDVDTLPDQDEHPRRAGFSRDSHNPLEKPARQVCGTVHLYRLEDGRLLARRVDCRTKACPKCGPRLREEYAAGYAAVLAAAGPVYRLQVADRDWRKLQARLLRRHASSLRLPAPDGRVVVYTTADLGEGVDNVNASLTSDFAAMPSDRRNLSATKAWRDAYHAWRSRQDGDQVPAEYLGMLRRPLEHVAMIAADLGMLLEQAGTDALLLHDPPDQATWERFCALAGLYRRGADKVARAA
jgi:hypothetical protein